MGNQPPPKQYNPRMEKQKLEIAAMKVKGHLELQRDRRMGQANAKEQQLIVMINSATRSMVEEKHKAAAIVSDISFIDACNIVIRCCDILKDRSMHICESKGNPAAIKELLPFIETIIWSTRHLNLACLQEFTNMMVMFFGSAQVPNSICDETKVDPQLKKCFENVMPTDLEINNYFVKLSQKTGITLSQMNVVGHEFSDQPPNPYGGNGGQQQQNVPIFVPNIQTQYPMNPQYPNQFGQQVGNLNINIRVQELPQGQQYPPQQGQQYPQYPPQQSNFNHQQGQQQQQQQQQQQYPQFPPQQPQYPPQQPQYPPQQPQYPPQQPQYPPADQNNAQNQPPKYNFPQVQIPQFNVQPQQQQQQQPIQPPSFQPNIPQQQVGGNNQMPGTDSLEERLRRIREGI